MHGERTFPAGVRVSAWPAAAWRSAYLAPLLAGLITIAGGLLRLYHLDALSLWVDEGLTVAYSHLPWATVLGLHGAYAPHPPLYFALVKVAALWLPDVIAGRTLSLVAGTLTIAVVYALATRLAGTRAGVTAALVLALSPPAIWYSQEGRPYALNTLLVGLSYLALVSYTQAGGRRWLAVYGVSLALAMYVEYSAVYALLPQLAILAYLARERRQEVRPMLGAAATAALAFVPWLPQLLTYAHGTSEQTQFALNPAKVGDVSLALTGLSGEAGYFWSSDPSAWGRWPAAHGLLLAVILLTGSLGALALWRRGGAGPTVALCLSVGTVAAAVVIGLVYPGFTYRTVLYAVVGWALLAGTAPLWPGRSRMALLGSLGLAAVLALSVVTADAFSHAYKQQFRLLAEDTAEVHRFGWPVMTYPAVTARLIDVYRPGSLAARHLAVDEDGELPATVESKHSPPSLWYAYAPDTYSDLAADRLAALGYQPLLQYQYTGPLYLTLYALPGSRLGHPLSINGRFRGAGGRATGWALPAGSRLVPASGNGERDLLLPEGKAESIAVGGMPAAPDRLYTLSYQARVQRRNGLSRAFLICASQTGDFLSVAPNGGGANVPGDGAWHRVRISVLCPAGTTWARIDLRGSGKGHVLYRDVSLEEASSSVR